jgi:SAM-dependent methyltransferase
MKESLFTTVALAALLASACNRNEMPMAVGENRAATTAEAEAPQAASENAPAAVQQEEPELEQGSPSREPDVVFVPTPQPVVDKMLELAKVKKTDVLYDLGCGDGRIPVTAAKRYGVKAWCFDIDPQRIEEANENVKSNNVEHLVTVELRDIFTLDLSPADVVTLYLLPELNVKLIPQLKKLKPGSRIVSHDFDMAGVNPQKTLEFTPSGDRSRTVYLWTTPLKETGN